MTIAAELESVALTLADTARELYQRGWMEGTAGNLSARLPGSGGRALITASGRSKGRLDPADVVEVDIATGQSVSSHAPRPSAETAIHTALYRLFPDCGAVAHAHPPYATVAASHAVRQRPGNGHVIVELRYRDFEIIKGFGSSDPHQVVVPVFPNWPDVTRIGRDVEHHFHTRAAGFPSVLLIAYHGATAWGPTLEIARNRLECLESLCRLDLINIQTTPPAKETP